VTVQEPRKNDVDRSMPEAATEQRQSRRDVETSVSVELGILKGSHARNAKELINQINNRYSVYSHAAISRSPHRERALLSLSTLDG
jgi:hypothetical protein